LHVDSFVPFGEDVPVVSEKDEVSLVVESHYSSALELGILGEKRSEESSDFDTDFGVEVVQDELGNVLGGDCVVLDFFLELDVGHFEDPKHALQVSDQQFVSVVVVSHDHYVSVVQGFCVVVNLVQFH